MRRPRRLAGSRLVAIVLCSLQFLPLRTASALEAGAHGFAGSAEGSGGESHGAEYVMRKYPGERLVPIRLLGGVRSPGTYYVPEGTDLVSIISLSGGIGQTADSSSIRYNRWSTQTSSTLDLKKAIEQPDLYNPKLSANDVLLIEESRPVISNNTMLILTFVATVMSITVGAIAIAKH